MYREYVRTYTGTSSDESDRSAEPTAKSRYKEKSRLKR